MKHSVKWSGQRSIGCKRTIEEAIKTLSDCNKKVHDGGAYYTKFRLASRIFKKGQPIEVAAKAKIFMSYLFAELLNEHSYKPIFSSDLR